MPHPSLALAAVLLLLGHVVADFFQGGLSRSKRRRPALPGGEPGAPKPLSRWLPWLALHGLLHGALTGLALMSWEAFVCESAAHAIIDFGKCEKLYGTGVDQALHLACKILWLALFLAP